MADARLRPHVPVLTYHSLDESGSPVSIAPGEFRRHMKELAAAGWRTMTPAQFVRGYRDGGWPARTFLLTFDDGYRSLLDHAVPIAAECAFTGTVFVATDRVGGVMTGPGEPAWTPASPQRHWDGQRGGASSGWSVASHACSHRALTFLPDAEVRRELAESRRTIEDRIGAPAATFAYPYGAVSPAVERSAAEHYDAAFGTTLARATVTGGTSHVARIDAYYLRRLPIGALDGTLLQLYLALRRAGRAMRARSVVNSEG